MKKRAEKEKPKELEETVRHLKETVKKYCDEKNITLKDLAEKMKIPGESLTRALRGNPTLATIQGIADGLNVDIRKLFASTGNSINGFIEYKGTIHPIQSVEDLERVLKLAKEAN